MSLSTKPAKNRTSSPLLQETKPFRPVRFIGLPPWLDDSLTNLKVHTFSAISFRCFPEWKMQPRKIGNDTFFFILSGNGTAEVNGKKFPLRAGTCLNLLRGVPHSITHNPKAPLSFASIHYSARIFESLTVPDVLGFPPTLDLQNDAKAKKDFEDACRIFALHPPAWESGLNALVTGILLHIIWNYGKHLKPQVIGSRAEDLRRLQPALAYLRLHLADSPPVGLLARQSGLSEPQFRRIFHRALGLSPVNYLRNLRMERACALLKTTDLTLEAISEQIGYQGASFFVTTFRKQFGISPGTFRHQPLS